jgi:hypothetical protein
MSKRRLLAISLILRLVAIPATAHAGSTITDKSYWPSEARQSVQDTITGSPSGLNALAYDGPVSSLQPATSTSEVESTRRYHGGPKFQ